MSVSAARSSISHHASLQPSTASARFERRSLNNNNTAYVTKLSLSATHNSKARSGFDRITEEFRNSRSDCPVVSFLELYLNGKRECSCGGGCESRRVLGKGSADLASGRVGVGAGA